MDIKEKVKILEMQVSQKYLDEIKYEKDIKKYIELLKTEINKKPRFNLSE